MENEVLQKVREMFLDRFDENTLEYLGDTQMGFNDPISEKTIIVFGYMADIINNILNELGLNEPKENVREVMKFLEEDIRVFVMNHLNRRDTRISQWN